MALSCLLHHLYPDCYMHGLRADANNLLMAIEIFAVADKYQITRPREYAVAAVNGLLDPEDDLENWVAAVKLVEEKSPVARHCRPESLVPAVLLPAAEILSDSKHSRDKLWEGLMTKVKQATADQ